MHKCLVETLEDLPIAQTQHVSAQAGKGLIASAVLGDPRLMDCTVHLEHQPKLGAVEVHDVPGDNVLTAKLPAGQSPPAQRRPEDRFGRCRLGAHRPRKGQLLGARPDPAAGRPSSHHRPSDSAR